MIGRLAGAGFTAVVFLTIVGSPPTAYGGDTSPAAPVLEPVADVRLELGGFVGQRVTANIEHWLKRAPADNPGLLEMFAQRDAGPPPDLVPWAGEFVGKYLISGVQALRMSDDPALRTTLAGVVDRLVTLQADDGYFGPWPKAERLRGHWDLWGHYHVLLGLLGWHEATGDRRALAAAQRIGDLVCATCLDSNFRAIDAGSDEMNLAILHGLARLYRAVPEPRYLRMAEEVLRDFERGGDYFRAGLAGTEFYRTPRPRWESLHCLQGMAELYRITGDPALRRAFLHHWASIRRFDQRNTGGFSSGEQATGSPYVNDPIETCCVIAWQAVMIDALRLTGDPAIADDLERATFNAALGAQHPSGAWCTYNTPMSGQRIPSHVEIRFQARPGALGLNCCSVNGPRGYGSLSEWAVLRRGAGLAINYYGPSRIEAKLAAGTPVTIRQETDYPIGGAVVMAIEPASPARFPLALRIPAWSRDSSVSVNDEPAVRVAAGRYLELDRLWQPGDRVRLQLDLRLSYEPGDREQLGRVSLYRGSVLLAADSRFADLDHLPILDVTQLGAAEPLATPAVAPAMDNWPVWITAEVPAGPGHKLQLIDFASAGLATRDGQPQSRYVTWLAAEKLRPPRPVAWQPPDGARLVPEAIRFAWRRPGAGPAAAKTYTLLISPSRTMDPVVARQQSDVAAWLVLPAEQVRSLKLHTPYYWKIVAENEHGQSESLGPYKEFQLDPAAPVTAVAWPSGQREADAMLIDAPLQGTVEPAYGALLSAAGWSAAPGHDAAPGAAVELDGQRGIIKYQLLAFPEEDYSAAAWVNVCRLPETQYGQIVSAWAGGGNDPLRIFVSGGKLAARIEAGRSYETPSVDIAPNAWHHVAAVKEAGRLTLYVDGAARGSTAAPARVGSSADCVAVGGNPHFPGPEFLAARIAGFRLYARALAPNEVRKLAEP